MRESESPVEVDYRDMNEWWVIDYSFKIPTLLTYEYNIVVKGPSECEEIPQICSS